MESNDFKITYADWDKFDWENIEESRGRIRMRKVLKYIPSNGLHLDVGTGRGDGTHVISQKKKTVGIDFGMRSLKIAAKKNDTLIQADACNLPFKSDIFESATCLDVIEHIPNAEKAVREIYSVLKPGGCLILETPQSEIMWVKKIGVILSLPFYKARGVARRLLGGHKVKKHSQPYDKTIPLLMIEEIIISAGFMIEKEKYVRYYHENPLILLFSFFNLFLCIKAGEER